MNPSKLFVRIASGNVANVPFRDFTRLLERLGFESVRTAGNHHIYAHPSVPEVVNVQNVGGQAKPYQVRQAWRLLQRYNLRLEDGQ